MFSILYVSLIAGLAGSVPVTRTVTVPAAADTSILNMFDEKNKNHGKEPSFGIARVASYGGSCDTLLRFDLGQVPRGSKILAATLKMNRIGNLTDGDLNTGVTARVTQPASSSNWSETQVTWSNAPARGKTDLFSIPIGPETLDGRTIAYTSPELVQWVQAAVKDSKIARAGWRMYTVTNGNQGVSLASRESAFPFLSPRLAVKYEDTTGETPKETPDEALSLSRFVVVKTGNPFAEELDGRIGLACNVGESITLFWPRPLEGGQSVVCRFSAIFPKYWTFQGSNAAGIFLTPDPPDRPRKTGYPVRGETTIHWAGSNRFTATGWVGGHSGSISPVDLQVKKDHEFYYRLSRQGERGKKFRVEFSRNGYVWTLLAEKELDGMARPYSGIYLNCPAKTNRAMIDIQAFTITSENQK